MILWFWFCCTRVHYEQYCYCTSTSVLQYVDRYWTKICRGWRILLTPRVRQTELQSLQPIFFSIQSCRWHKKLTTASRVWPSRHIRNGIVCAYRVVQNYFLYWLEYEDINFPHNIPNAPAMLDLEHADPATFVAKSGPRRFVHCTRHSSLVSRTVTTTVILTLSLSYSHLVATLHSACWLVGIGHLLPIFSLVW